MSLADQFQATIHANGVAELVINRPPVNALNAAGWYGLAAEIERLGNQSEVRVIIIRAEGKGFARAWTSKSWPLTLASSSM